MTLAMSGAGAAPAPQGGWREGLASQMELGGPIGDGSRAIIFQHDVVFQRQQSFGKGLGESPCALKLGAPASLKHWRWAHAAQQSRASSCAQSPEPSSSLYTAVKGKKERTAPQRRLVLGCVGSLEADVMQMRWLQKLITLKGQNSRS